MRFDGRRRLSGDLAAFVRESEALRPVWEQFVNNSVEKVVNNSPKKVNTNHKLDRVTLRFFGADEERQKLFTWHFHQPKGLSQMYCDYTLEVLSEVDHLFSEHPGQWWQIKGQLSPIRASKAV